MIINLSTYRKIKNEILQTKHSIKVLEDVATLLYNNLDDSLMWHLVKEIESIIFEKRLEIDFKIQILQKLRKEM